MTFRACRVFEDGGEVAARIAEMEVDELSAGEVVIRAEASGINYKDALAATGRGKILRRFPMNAGIDVAGTVESSSDPRYREGDPVLVNGMGLGEVQDGGLAERVRVPADWIVPLPSGLDAFEAMALGTAGFTAALALERMEALGQRPDLGPVLVTGAAGGVGSIAIQILAAKGYETIAVSGRPEHRDWLVSIGAGAVETPEGLGLGSRPLESARFGGVVDNVGGDLLAALIPHVRPWGSVASIGNAGGAEFRATVFPLILRGVSLLGVSSANCPMPLRTAVWNRLGAEGKPAKLDAVVARRVRLDGVLPEFARVLDREVRGRIVVDCR